VIFIWWSLVSICFTVAQFFFYLGLHKYDQNGHQKYKMYLHNTPSLLVFIIEDLLPFSVDSLVIKLFGCKFLAHFFIEFRFCSPKVLCTISEKASTASWSKCKKAVLLYASVNIRTDTLILHGSRFSWKKVSLILKECEYTFN